MEKKVLEQYIDACELIKETEKDIRRLKKEAADHRADERVREQSGISVQSAAL